jgi:hypothetical protein
VLIVRGVQIVEAQLTESGISFVNECATRHHTNRKSLKKEYFEVIIKNAAKGRISFLYCK